MEVVWFVVETRRGFSILVDSYHRGIHIALIALQRFLDDVRLRLMSWDRCVIKLVLSSWTLHSPDLGLQILQFVILFVVLKKIITTTVTSIDSLWCHQMSWAVYESTYFLLHELLRHLLTKFTGLCLVIVRNRASIYELIISWRGVFPIGGTFEYWFWTFKNSLPSHIFEHRLTLSYVFWWRHTRYLNLPIDLCVQVALLLLERHWSCGFVIVNSLVVHSIKVVVHIFEICLLAIVRAWWFTFAWSLRL